jgi:L-ascorbate metabolism protein UlaG (beta-lactamase superfamily)
MVGNFLVEQSKICLNKFMTITKLGHCCLLIEVRGKRILTDPGMFTTDTHSKLEDLDYVLFTHEHPDHFHLESLKKILELNAGVKVYANVSVGDLLENAGMVYTLVQSGEEIGLGEDLFMKGVGTKHAEMHSSMPASDNTGYLLDNRLWYPGDSLTDPQTSVEILALPVAGPWMKISEAIDYAIKLKPKFAFPVHDGIYNKSIRGTLGAWLPGRILPTHHIEFIPLADGESKEFY